MNINIKQIYRFILLFILLFTLCYTIGLILPYFYSDSYFEKRVLNYIESFEAVHLERKNLPNIFNRLRLFTFLPIKILARSDEAIIAKVVKGNPYIIKRISTKNFSTEEAHICGMILHPNIVKINQICHIAEAKISYIFMEYLDIQFSIVSINKKSEILKAVLMDVINGLQYLHHCNIAHLDIKIENIGGLRKKDGSIIYKIIDFGLSRIIHVDYTDENVFSGTFPFKPPEIAILGIYSLKSDIWCLGMMLFCSFNDNFLHVKEILRDNNYEKVVDFVNKSPILGWDILTSCIQLTLQIDPMLRPDVQSLKMLL